MQKFVRLKNAGKDPIRITKPLLEQKSQRPSWPSPADVPTDTASSEASSHQYPPTVVQSATYDTPQRSLHTSSGTTYQTQQQPLTQPQSWGAFFEYPQMAHDPISGYQYHDYQDTGYFQQQMEHEPGYDASGDVYMPMSDESWQNFMNQIRQ